MTSSLPARVQALAEQVAASHDVEILDVTLAGGGRARVLDVVVDADADADEPLGSERTARLAKDLSRALDEADPIRGAYTLRVGTPGLDRPLRTARDFRRQLGREVDVVLHAPADPAGGPDPGAPGGAGGGASVLRGVVRDVTGDEVTLEADDDQRQVLPLDGIDHGKVVLPW